MKNIPGRVYRQGNFLYGRKKQHRLAQNKPYHIIGQPTKPWKRQMSRKNQRTFFKREDEHVGNIKTRQTSCISVICRSSGPEDFQ